MSKTKFTPGPWLFSSYKSGTSVIVIDGKEFGVATVNYPNRDANAHLIAAAPELYEALEKIRHWGESQHKAQSKGGHATFDMMMLREQIDTAEAALAKARGEG